MWAALTIARGKVDLAEVPEPAPGPGEVLVDVGVVGLCGGDMHIYRGQHPYATYPVVQGHEFCGRVVSFGPGYQGELRLGEVVAVEPLLPCGHCFACRRAHSNCCSALKVMGAHVGGALAERVAVRASSCYPVADLPADLAALVEPVSIGLQAVVRSGAGAGDQVLVLGAGPIGQAVIVCAVDRGAEVMAVDKLPKRLELAKVLGAKATVDTVQTSLTDEVAEWTGGDGPAVVVDATGVPALIRQGVDLVAPSGTVVIVGISINDVPLSVVDFTRKELNILGSRNNAGLFGASVEIVQRYRDQLAHLITHRFAFDQTPAAMQFLDEHPDDAEKVQVVVSGPW